MPDPTEQPRRVAIAIAAHPDDIEFMMAGTLLLLREAGWETHCLNISSGNCGSVSLSAEEIEAKRLSEAREAAAILGATFHPPFSRDLEVFYDLRHLRHLASIIRDVNPSIVLTHSPEDYMEDHTNTSRLAVTAAFSRGMPNFEVSPARPTVDGEVAVYHGMPHGMPHGLMPCGGGSRLGCSSTRQVCSKPSGRRSPRIAAKRSGSMSAKGWTRTCKRWRKCRWRLVRHQGNFSTPRDGGGTRTLASAPKRSTR